MNELKTCLALLLLVAASSGCAFFAEPPHFDNKVNDEYFVVTAYCDGFAGDAYPYEPVVVKLTGVIKKEFKFGPPNFGETPMVDRLLPVYSLELKTPIVAGTINTLSETNDTVVVGVKHVQIISLDGYSFFEKSVGKEISIDGNLSKAISGHHYWPIVFVTKTTGICNKGESHDEI